MKWNRLTRLIGTGSVIVLAIVIFTPITRILSRPMLVPTDIRPSEAIVVLGSGVAKDGSLSYESAQRLFFGMRLFKDGLAPLLVLSGPSNEGSAPESTIRARTAEELGIPRSAMLEISTAHTTREEALESAAMLTPRNLRHVVLVTGSLHMLRSKLVFEAAGLTVSPAPSDNFPNYASSAEERLLLLRGLVIHSVGLLYYRIAGFI